MKILMLIVAVAALGVILLGCTKKEGPPALSNYDYDRTSDMTVRTDPLTGCQYLTSGHGITPRMGADGKQICKKP